MRADTDSTTVRGSPFRCTVPDRAKSAVLSLVGLTIAAVFLFVPVAGWFLSLIALAFAVLFSLAAVVPGKFLMGVALLDDGFEFRAPLKSPKRIAFESIQRIDALARGDGGYGDSVDLLIQSHAGKVLIRDAVLLESGLLSALESRLPLDRAAYQRAGKYEPRGLDLLFGKRFMLYESGEEH